MVGIMIKTKRLILRPWKEEDLEPFAKLNSDPKVMEYFPGLLNAEESNQLAHDIQHKIEENGYGMWAVSIVDVSDFIGFIGLNAIDFSKLPVHFAPAVEIGWRLAAEYWGKGYATEGALACLEYGFETLHLNEIVAFTAVQNRRSRAVMKRLGMHHNSQDDFDHPKVPEGYSLRRHVLYRIGLNQWKNLNK